MAVTSVKVNGLELIDSGTYYVAQATYFALWAGVPRTARLVEMAGRYPAYVGATPTPRTIPLLVMLEAKTAAQRITDYEALLSAVDTTGLVALEWTEDGATRRYWCHVGSVEPSDWMTKAAVGLTAPNPDAEVI